MTDSYTVRGLKLGKEGTFGTSIACDTNFNYLMSWEATTSESLLEEEIVGGDRDAVKIAALQKEVTGRVEAELLNAKVFEYALGGYDTIATGYTIKPASTLPSFTLERGAGTNNVAVFSGCKVDTAVINLAVGEGVTYELNFIAQDSTMTEESYTAPSLSFTLDPYMFYHGALTANGNTITELQSVVIEINNNLSPRYSADRTRSEPRSLYSLREGRLQVSGRIVTGGSIEMFTTLALEQVTFGIELSLVKGAETIEMTIPVVQLEEWSDVMRGREPYELEFPFRAKPTSGLDIMKMIQYGGDTYGASTII